jgi:hypothetical protein
VWTSCDLASAGNTAILNANSSFPPTVEHRFEYTEGDVVEGDVAVESEVESSDLDAILSRNGFGRSDVVDARIDSVRIRQVSGPSLRDAELFLGASTSGPRVAQVEFPADGTLSVVDDTPRSVTQAVRDGTGMLYGRFGLETPGAGVVRARVYYRLEVEGV